MKSLALDTSRKSFSIALLDGHRLVAELTSDRYLQSLKHMSPPAKRVAASPRIDASALLVPMISQTLDRQSLSINDLDLISVCRGPGSFTGLRVGVVTAKTLAYATKLPLIAVDALRAAATQTIERVKPDLTISSIVATVNAQRGQLFATRFELQSEMKNDMKGESRNKLATGTVALDEGASLGLLTPDQLAKLLREGDLLTGEGLLRTVSVFRNTLEKRSEPSFQIAPERCWLTTASTVGKLGIFDFELGKTSDMWTLSPVYFRPSSAEEVARQRQANIKNG